MVGSAKGGASLSPTQAKTGLEWGTRAVPINSPERQFSLALPVLEDAHSIQVAITQIMGLIISGDLDSKKAGHLLYALQIASSNLRHMRYVSSKDYVVDPAETRNFVLDKFDSLSKIGRLRCPVFIMHGERDSVIPIRYGRELFQAASEPKEAKWFADGNHTNFDEFGGAAAVLDFLKRQGVAA